MLSCMDTPLGFTVISPMGKQLRLQANHPAYRAGRDIVRQTLPAEQVWHQLQELVSNPLNALVTWCERFGLALTGDGDTLHLNDRALSSQHWLPLLQRAHGVGASPLHLRHFAELLGSEAEFAQVGNLTLHLYEDKLSGYKPSIVRQVLLPAEAMVGDIVLESSTGVVPFLVSYQDFKVSSTGAVLPIKGMVLSKVVDAPEVADILAQPVILGFNQTYRCEEGSAKGWLRDFSFDSLQAAQNNAKVIQASGSDVRIINCITGDNVALD